MTGRDLPVPAWHALAADDTCRALSITPGGLTSAEAEARLRRHGENRLPAPKGRGVAAIVLGQLRSPLIYLLLAAAAVSLWLGHRDDAAFILAVLLLNTAIGASQEWRAESSAAALRSTLQSNVRVLRDGTVQRLDSALLAPGDRILLEGGDRVPADIRLALAIEAEADESLLTGESAMVTKQADAIVAAAAPPADRATMLYAGAMLVRGRTEGWVVATGPATELGRIAASLDSAAQELPLLRRLERFATFLGLASVALVVLVGVIQAAAGVPLRDIFFIAVALAVAVIPEGLPVAVTVALALATHRMARRNVIVRRLPAVEGLGACTVIATDKTGTLTVNELTVTHLWLPDAGVVAMDLPAGAPERGRAVHRLAASAALCNDATYDPAKGQAGQSGDTVDIALLALAHRAGLDIAAIRAASPRIDEVPFSAERRLAASVNRSGEGAELHVKGAAEAVLPLCLDVDIQSVLGAVNELAAQGFRVLAIARRPFDDPTETLPDALAGLDLLGLAAFIDPLRANAAAAVADCHAAGIAVKMITGDHPATALAIARQAGIAQPGDAAMTGVELAALDLGDQAARARVSAATVFARIEPRQKLLIVEALQAEGEIVAMTGDGVNDAPALHRADIGVAMGRGGTDVARDAADLVLTDDNFASIVAGVEEGRAAYANIRKVIYLLVSTGAAEAVLFLLAVASGLPAPLTAVQLLWLNLVTNGGQDVALSFERREDGLLQRRPRRPDEPIFDAAMLRQTAVSGLFVGIVAWSFFAWAIGQGWSEFEARNALLFLMVLFENVHVFNCRSETRSAFRVPFANNWPVVAAAFGAQAIHIGAAFVPGLNGVLQVAPIDPGLWLALLGLAASLLAAMEMDKWLRRGRSGP